MNEDVYKVLREAFEGLYSVLRKAFKNAWGTIVQIGDWKQDYLEHKKRIDHMRMSWLVPNKVVAMPQVVSRKPRVIVARTCC